MGGGKGKGREVVRPAGPNSETERRKGSWESEVPPLHQLVGLGECCKLPSRVWGTRDFCTFFL